MDDQQSTHRFDSRTLFLQALHNGCVEQGAQWPALEDALARQSNRPWLKLLERTGGWADEQQASIGLQVSAVVCPPPGVEASWKGRTALGCVDGMVHIFDQATNALVKVSKESRPLSWKIGEKSVVEIAWSEGGWLAARTADDQVSVWRPDGGSSWDGWHWQPEVIYNIFKGHSSHHLKWSVGGWLEARTADGQVLVWRPDGHRAQEEWMPSAEGSIAEVEWLMNGLIMTRTHNEDVRVWNLTRRAEAEPILIIMRENIQSLALSADRRLAIEIGRAHV